MEAFRPYESPELRAVTGRTLRPGGFTLTGRAVEVCHLMSGATVLDMGCGLGATVNRLETTHGLNALGLDASRHLLHDGKMIYPSASLMAGLAQQLPVKEKSLDGVFCECVLSLLDNPGLALSEFARILKPEGWLVITDLYAKRPEGVFTLQHLPVNSCLKGTKSRQEIVRTVKENGFELFLWEDHSQLLKQMAAEIVFEFGSMHEFWKFFAPYCEVTDLECSLGQVRPGYYLMAARKKGGLNE